MMSASATMKAQIVRIRYEEGKTGLFYAVSPDLKGLLVAKPTMDALRDAIPDAIRDLYAACGVRVVVTPAEDSDPDYYPWVATPFDLARRALDQKQKESVEA
jgi:hypothetical protein